jgi:amidase
VNSSEIESAFATAAETAAALRSRRISARDLLDLTFERIDRHNPTLNAIVWQDRDQAMARARGADEALAHGNASGALLGVPVTIKESFAYTGSPSTWGVPALKDSNSPRTAIAVERLETAGAIVVAKTNVPVSCSGTGKAITRFMERRTIRGTWNEHRVARLEVDPQHSRPVSGR